MPEDQPRSAHISLRVPEDLIAAYDRLAAVLERPRSWVMLRALRCYLDEEGAEIEEDSESLAELARGEVVSSEEMQHRLHAIIDQAEKMRAKKK